MTKGPHEWQPMETAPRDRPVWLRIGRYERIATWRAHDHAPAGDWFFDSKQANHWFYKGAGQLNYVSAWAELRSPDEQDPANLGRPRTVTDPALVASPEALHTHSEPQAVPACGQTNAQQNFFSVFEEPDTDHPSELTPQDQPLTKQNGL